MDLHLWKKQQQKLRQIVTTLKKNTKLSELYQLNLQHPGLLTTFWREYGDNPNFVEWFSSMEKRDPNWEDHIKPHCQHSENSTPNITEDNIIRDEELSIKDKIRLIREKYDNIN